MKGILFLGIAIVFEVFGSVMLKLSTGFTVLFPSLGVIIGFLASFVFLGLSLKSLPLSSAYAIWSGLGTALTACAGVFLFGESIGFLKFFALSLIVAGVFVLNGSQENKQTQQTNPTHSVES